MTFVFKFLEIVVWVKDFAIFWLLQVCGEAIQVMLIIHCGY